MATSFIKRHILRLPKDRIFSTRDMLIYGTRSAVDSAMHRLVKSGFIKRLAWGIFIKSGSKIPTFVEIVRAKTAAFGKKLGKHAKNILTELKISTDSDQFLFSKNGHTSSFGTVRGRAYLRGICPKKFTMCETAVGRVIYALWYRGSDHCTSSDVRLASSKFGRREREQFWLSARLMPAWLTNICRHRFPTERIFIPDPPEEEASMKDPAPPAPVKKEKPRPRCAAGRKLKR